MGLKKYIIFFSVFVALAIISTPNMVFSVGASCGSAAKTYPYTGSTTNIYSSMCSPGSASPSSVTLGASGGSYVSWQCQSIGGSSVNCTATRAAPIVPTLTLSAFPNVVPSVGSTSTLTWSSSNATSCTASGDWSEIKATSGNQSVTISKTNNNYILTCTGVGGSVSETVTVTVVPPPTLNFSAFPSNTIIGGNSHLTWSSSNATSCTASGDWSGTKAISGDQWVTISKVTNNYILTCTNAGGSVSKTVIIFAMIYSFELAWNTPSTSASVCNNSTLNFSGNITAAVCENSSWDATVFFYVEKFVGTDGTCGTAAKTYPVGSTAFSGTMCGNGNGVTTPASPIFPTMPGVPTTWTCGGSCNTGHSLILLGSETYSGIGPEVVPFNKNFSLPNNTYIGSNQIRISYNGWSAHSGNVSETFNRTINVTQCGSPSQTCGNQSSSCVASISSAVNGVCGAAARTYEIGEPWPGGYAYCTQGNPSPNPPATLGASGGSTTSWTCSGEGEGSPSPTCTATRASLPGNPCVAECGPAARDYAQGEPFPGPSTTWFMGEEKLCWPYGLNCYPPWWPTEVTPYPNVGDPFVLGNSEGSTIGWRCLGTNAGSWGSVNCSAARHSEATCGTAIGVPHFSAPTTGLCSKGCANTVNGGASGPWNWQCCDYAFCVNCSAPAVTDCGTAHGKVYSMVDYADWLTGGWNYRKEITISNANVDSNLTNFPLLVKLSNDAGVGSHISDTTNGYDIRFTDSSGNLLSYERESFSVTSGSATGVFWVKVPIISSSADTIIYMYYGNSSASDGQDKTAVWDSNYKSVWHMANSASPATDSTSNVKNANQAGGVTFGATGKIGKAVGFDGLDDYLQPGSVSTTVTNNFGLSAWVNPAVLPQLGHIFENGFNNGWGIGISNGSFSDTTGSKLNALYGGVAWIDSGYTFISPNAWYYVSLIRDNGTAKFYVNGTQTTSVSPYLGYTPTTPTSTIFGRRQNQSPASARYFNGFIDEVRVSNIARSDAWLEFEYHNMADSGNNLTFGAESTNRSLCGFCGDTLCSNSGVSSPINPIFPTLANPITSWVCNDPNGAPARSCSARLDINLPEANNLNTNAFYCGNSPYAQFNWTYNSDTNVDETSFLLQIDNNSNFSSQEVVRLVAGLSYPSGSQNNQSVSIKINPGYGDLAYNTTYYWRVKVVDSQGYDSGWVTGPSFTTEDHPWPAPNFVYSPTNPLFNTQVVFTDNPDSPSLCYETGNVAYDCKDNPEYYTWWYGDPHTPVNTPNGDDSNKITTNYAYPLPNTTRTSYLEICDELGCCIAEKNVNIRGPQNVPNWQELSPF